MMNAGGTAPTLAGRAVQPRSKDKSFVEFSEIAGTPSYLAPELWRNESYTESVDVYSYGVVLWELLARDTPFRELSNEDLIIAMKQKCLRPPIPRWTPLSFKIMLERCWGEVPKSRPTFQQLVVVLKLTIDQEVHTWPLPENYSLDEEEQARARKQWELEQANKKDAITTAEQRLLAAKQQLHLMKGNADGASNLRKYNTVGDRRATVMIKAQDAFPGLRK